MAKFINGVEARKRVRALIDDEFGGNPDALAVELGCTGAWLRLVLRDETRALPDTLLGMLNLERQIAYAEA